MSLVQKNMLKQACEVNCPVVEIREAQPGIPTTARASILLEGTAGIKNSFTKLCVFKTTYGCSWQIPYFGVRASKVQTDARYQTLPVKWHIL